MGRKKMKFQGEKGSKEWTYCGTNKAVKDMSKEF